MAKSLRPKGLDEYIGQNQIIDQLKIFIEATEIRAKIDPKDCALHHTMLEGGAGLGKTSLAMVIANELQSNIRIMQGKAIKTLGDLAKNLVDLNDGDILFIDEIHTLEYFIEEMLYSVMEDFRLDIMVEQGMGDSRPVSINLNHFTLIGATTEIGRLQQPFRDRFKYSFTFERYSPEELVLIIHLNVEKMHCTIDDESANKIAKASRGIPRIALTTLTICCDWALVENNGNINSNIVLKAFKYSETTDLGLKRSDIKYLSALNESYRPIGLKVLSEKIGIDIKTIENVIEPYLHEQRYIEKMPNGRIISEKGIKIINSINSQTFSGK